MTPPYYHTPTVVDLRKRAYGDRKGKTFAQIGAMRKPELMAHCGVQGNWRCPGCGAATGPVTYTAGAGATDEQRHAVGAALIALVRELKASGVGPRFPK